MKWQHSSQVSVCWSTHVSDLLSRLVPREPRPVDSDVGSRNRDLVTNRTLTGGMTAVTPTSVPQEASMLVRGVAQMLRHSRQDRVLGIPGSEDPWICGFADYQVSGVCTLRLCAVPGQRRLDAAGD